MDDIMDIINESSDGLIPKSPTGEGDDLGGGGSNETPANPSNSASAGGSNESSVPLRFPSPPIDVSVQITSDDNTTKGKAVLATPDGDNSTEVSVPAASAPASAPIAPAPSADMGTKGKTPVSESQMGAPASTATPRPIWAMWLHLPCRRADRRSRAQTNIRT